MEEAERAAEETRKRGRGNPNMRPGVSSVNPTGKPKAVDREALEADSEELARLEERAEQAEAELAELREQLAGRDAKAQLKVALARVAELEKEVAELRAAKAVAEEPDPGSERARALIRRCLLEAGA